MSVYTTVSERQLRRFLERYDVGAPRHFEGITEGIENTNYLLVAEHGEYILTLFERQQPEELPFFLRLMAFLADRGLPSAQPLANLDGDYLGSLNHKPATLVQRLRGSSVKQPAYLHCVSVGQCLARMHLAVEDFPLRRVTSRGPAWWRSTADRVAPRLPAEERELLYAELAYQQEHDYTELPGGVIHADLFRDNILFQDTRLSGIIDFYYACDGAYMYDLAVAVNDWCYSDEDRQDDDNANALLAAYRAERSVSDAEITAWPVMLRAAALRFWLSRLEDKLFPRHGHITHVKEPRVFRDLLLRNIDAGEGCCEAWLARAATSPSAAL